jgi:general secretion pathway protein F
MARAGLPLDQGLAALAREMGGGRLRQATEEIAADLRAGHTLPQALERQSGRVPSFYAALVAAGVRSGRVGEVLATLTVYARTIAELRATIVGALCYPAIVVILSFGLFAFVACFILPQYEQILTEFGLKAPLATELVLALARRPVEFLLVPPAIVLGILLLLYVSLRLSPGGRLLWARFVYALPLIGTLVRAARLAAFADLLGILIDNGLPLPEAYQLAGASSSDPLVASATPAVEAALREGQPLGSALRERHLLPELVVWMIGLGEQRGTLGPALHQAAEVYRRQVEMRAALLRTVLPPFVIILTAGVIVILFVLTVMLPMFTVLEGLSK